MYLTVQRVASAKGERGLNGALYRHRADRKDPMWVEPDIQHISSWNLGTQIACRTDVKPGGNAVECFLDVVFPDDFTDVEVRDVLARVRLRLEQPRIVVKQPPAAVAFSQNLGEGARILDNYDQLTAAAIQLLGSQTRVARAESSPLCILATANESGWQFELTDEAKDRIRAHSGSRTLARINIPLDVADDFRQIYGSLYPFVAEWATDMSRAELTTLGGVQVVHNDTIVWEWGTDDGSQTTTLAQ